MKRTFFRKILYGYIAIISLIVILVLGFSFQAVKSYHLQLLTDHMVTVGTLTKSKIGPLVEAEKIAEAEEWVVQLGRDSGLRINLIDPQGKMLSDSTNQISPDNQKQYTEILIALTGETGKHLRRMEESDMYRLYVALPIVNSSQSVIGVVRVSFSLEDIYASLIPVWHTMVRIAIIAFLLALIGALWLARNVTLPIEQLSQAVSKISKGNFETKVFLQTNDEVQTLADNFNTMTEQMRHLFDQLRESKEEMDSIILSIQEGVCVIDRHGIVTLANNSFVRIFPEMKPGEYYWETLRNVYIGELLKESKDKKQNLIKELQWNERDYLCSTTYVSAKKEMIIVVHDITQIKQMEQMKKDLVVNVSHELKTPLTALKGFSETLQDMEEDEQKKHYLDIIVRHIYRLSRIVEDLLVLSELENDRYKLVQEPVELVKILTDVASMFESAAEEKGLQLKLEMESNLPPIKGDSFKLEQVFINLIDNAIKYTDQGSIHVLAIKDQKNIKITIQDTGIGMPQEAVSRVFERFYTVDKSRSRKLGGTGLGLSIVKHSVLLHDGSIDLKSQLGKGSTFVLKFPY